MSEHRRKPPQQDGGRTAARRAAQQPSVGHTTPPRETTMSSASVPHSDERPYGGRAEARRAAQRGGSRRRMDGGAGSGHGGRGGGRRGGGGGGHEGGGGQPGRKRLIDYPRRGKYGWRRWMPSWKLVSGLCLGFFGALMTAATIAYAMVGVPDPDKMAEAENNVYYWDDGTQMAATGGERNRQNIELSQIPMDMQNAVISAENKDFWNDSGVDPVGIGRALLNMAKGEDTQGGSTITQQYVKNARLNDQSQTLSRKFKELFISIKIDSNVEKPDIMAGYLNTSYYGRGAHGIQAAARTYYGKDAKKLNASECAVLASLLKGATWFDPAGATDIHPRATPEGNYKRAKDRWNWILDEMVKDGHLDAAERDKFVQEGFPMPDPVKKGAKLGGQIGYLVDVAKQNFLSNNDLGVDADDLAQGGYEIHTTFNKEKIKKLEKAVTKIQKENIDPKKRPDTDTHVQFGGASVEPATGKIVAIYGGEDATKHFTNNADVTGAQVGSTFKPFVLAAAMRDGVRDPELGPEQSLEQRTLINPDKAIYNGKNLLRINRYDGEVWRDDTGKDHRQVNDGDQSYPDMDLREAMIVSANSPYVQLGMDIGIPQVRQAAVDAGLLEDSLTRAEVPSFSIGISSPSAIRMASSYATFAARGEQRDPYSVTHAKKNGKTIFKHKDAPKGAFTQAVADNVTDVLKDVVEAPNGTGGNAEIPGRPVAGKTGTTDGNRSAWFVGYTPQLSTAIDMYRFDDDDSKKNREFLKMFGTGGQQKIHGASFPSDIWKLYMSDVLEGEPVKQFPKPEPIGEAVWGGGAVSPPPTPSEEPSETPSSEPPSEEPSETPSDEPSETPSESCDPWEDWSCGDPGGSDGGKPGGSDGGKPGGSDGGKPGGSGNEGAANEGAASEGAASEGAASEGAASEGAASEGAASEGAASEGAANGNPVGGARR
ncbi:transglycosylase domain-containing protein [Streptomyces jumonjinensis]|uniref:transglycosylase domain-containing protein n=1 Tax=Streptomyces jumonjinensis TaxID=1945 RepID=UPI0033282316